MLRRLITFVGGCLVCISLLVACDRPIGGTDEPPGRRDRNDCLRTQLVAPQILADQGGYVETLRPEFRFSYPEPCIPDSFLVEVAPEGAFDGLGLMSDSLEGSADVWSPGYDMPASTRLQWRVAAVVGEQTGPYSPIISFHTGPLCDTAAMVAPSLHSPAEGEHITVLNPELIWKYPAGDCLQEEFGFQVASLPNSPGVGGISGETGPYTSFETNVNFLQDCGLYQWQAWAISEDVAGPTPEPKTFYVDLEGACPEFCSLEMLIAPQVHTPSGYVEDLRPLFEWFYEDGCAPLGYQLDLAVGGFEETAAMQSHALGPDNNWLPEVDLDPATLYQWRVAAALGNTIGPYSPAPYFWTGPICADPAPAAPTLISPIGDEVITIPNPILTWTYPDESCIPEETLLEVATDPGFSSFAIWSHGPGIWTEFEPPQLLHLADCTIYYWRTATGSEEAWGTYSAVETFRTDFTSSCVWQSMADVQLYTASCLPERRMMFTFRFPEPVVGSYKAEFPTREYTCEVRPQSPYLLYCYGVAMQEGYLTTVDLVQERTGNVVFSGTVTSPVCATPEPDEKKACQPKTCPLGSVFDPAICDCRIKN